ncbi:hypothetical protein D9M68_20470 [compost metagenome]
MHGTINDALVGAAEQLESEVSLAPALPVISEMADIADSRIVLESCVEQMTMADGSVVEVLEAEQTYRDWRAEHRDFASGNAMTGMALSDEIRVTMEMLNNPSMESNLVQQLKRTFNTITLNLKTFGKDLVNIRGQIGQHKDDIAARPVLIDTISAYTFLTRNNKPVKNIVTSIDEDLKFIDALEKHYKTLFDKSTDLGKRFRDACNSDSNENIRDAIDYFDENILDRTEFVDLTKFHLLGNRVVYLDKRGYPTFKTTPVAWKFSTKEKDEKNLVTQLAKKAIHGFSIGGEVKSAKGVVGINIVLAKKQVTGQIKATGGETEVAAFIKCLDQAINLNTRAVKFAQMAATMGEKVQRLSGDMDDAYDHVNTEKSSTDNAIRLRELRALHRSARRSVSQYMFLGKSMATMMEDHASYVYRNITLIANDVLKKTVKEEPKK